MDFNRLQQTFYHSSQSATFNFYRRTAYDGDDVESYVPINHLIRDNIDLNQTLRFFLSFQVSLKSNPILNSLDRYIWTLIKPLYGQGSSIDSIKLAFENGAFLKRGTTTYDCNISGSVDFQRTANDTRYSYKVDCVSGEPIGENGGPPFLIDSRYQSWYTRASASGSSWSAPFCPPSTDYVQITAAQSMFTAKGRFLGVAGVNYLISSIEELLQSAAATEYGVYTLFIVDSSGKLVASSISGVAYDNCIQVKASECNSSIINATARFIESSTVGGWEMSNGTTFTSELAQGSFWILSQRCKDDYGLIWYLIVVQKVQCPLGYAVNISSSSVSCEACPAGK